jgi:sec-independent protein translocase protein TatA
MGEFSFIHWILVLGVVLLFFGAGHLPKTMGDLGKALHDFREGLNAKDDSEK